MQMDEKKIALILPGIVPGGLERVMVELANSFSLVDGIEVHVISLTKGEQFYRLEDKVIFHEPSFFHRSFDRITFTVKTFRFLRIKLKEVKPLSLLSFGGKYNAFVLLAAMGIGIRSYISDRSRPRISYGKILDILNPILYKRAAGIIAQTEKAKQVHLERTGHKNIRVIGNPIRQTEISPALQKQNIILNVGRFIASKHQDILLEYFASVNSENWRLIFLGDGKLKVEVEAKAIKLGLKDRVEFPGAVKNVDEYYRKSKIFAFTSTSEGFPNVLGEAMSAGCACISYDCEAGPSELIDDGINGYLIEETDHKNYKSKLQSLIDDEELCIRFGEASRKKIVENFGIRIIRNKYLDFITG